MKKILVDVDEVICDTGFLALINKFLGTSYTFDDFSDYYIDDVIGNESKRKEFYKWIQDYNMYDYANVLPGAYEVLKELNEYYDIYVYSACVNPFFVEKSGKQFMDKYNYLQNNFPFIDPNKYIFTNSKNLIKADIQIDDRVDNLMGDVTTKLLFTSYHNKNISDLELDSMNIKRMGTSSDNAWESIRDLLL